MIISTFNIKSSDQKQENTNHQEGQNVTLRIVPYKMIHIQQHKHGGNLSQEEYMNTLLMHCTSFDKIVTLSPTLIML